MKILLVAFTLVAATALAQSSSRSPTDPAATPEDRGALQGSVDGRRQGQEKGRDLGRAQSLSAAWWRGFRLGLTEDASWRRDHSWDEGVAEGLRPGRAAGLDAGRERGRLAADAAWMRLAGRPARSTEAPPNPPSAPEPPHHPACDEPTPITLRFSDDRDASVRPQDVDRTEPPLGDDVPKPNYPDESVVHDRARMDGYDNATMESWVHGYKSAFKEEFRTAYRAQRETTPAATLRQWETEGDIAGRREGERRRACTDFARGYESGFRDGFDEGFGRGFDDAWDEEDQRHSEGPVVRIVAARLIDESGDGVIEPGEGVSASVDVANAGMRDSDRALSWDGRTTVHASGASREPLRAQSRRTESIDLGRADDAPFGSGIDVALRGENGDDSPLSASIGRPVVLDSADARLDVRDGRLVTLVTAHVANVSTRDVDRGLRVGSTELGTVRAGERRDVELVVPASASALADRSSGNVALVAGDRTWMQRDWSLEPRFGDSLVLASRLSPNDDALAALSRRLLAELDRAMADPKLYARLDEGSDLAELARVRPTLPSSARAAIDARLSRPLLDRAESKSTPRKVRKAIRAALGKGE